MDTNEAALPFTLALLDSHGFHAGLQQTPSVAWMQLASKSLTQTIAEYRALQQQQSVATVSKEYALSPKPAAGCLGSVRVVESRVDGPNEQQPWLQSSSHM